MARESQRVKPHPESGFTLIELAIAGVVLVFGMLSLIGLLMVAIGNNGRSKIDSTATMLNQTVVEQISAELEGGGPGTITDCAGNIWTIDYSAGAPPAGIGAALKNGNIDFTQVAPPNNFFMNYVECNTQPNGKVVQTMYDVRWNTQNLGSSSYLITVGARPKGGLPARFAFAIPVNMRVIVGQR